MIDVKELQTKDDALDWFLEKARDAKEGWFSLTDKQAREIEFFDSREIKENNTLLESYFVDNSSSYSLYFYGDFYVVKEVTLDEINDENSEIRVYKTILKKDVETEETIDIELTQLYEEKEEGEFKVLKPTHLLFTGFKGV